MKNILSFDIEDNFTKSELSDPADWMRYEGQVVENTERILRLLEEYNTTATFFVLGKVADRRPEVVKIIHEAGHELASHGYIHEWVDHLGVQGFKDDVSKSKESIERITGQRISGFRAMAFSIGEEHAWALNYLKDKGFKYDSSILSSCFSKYNDNTDIGDCFQKQFYEVPPSSKQFAGVDFTIGGGIFFRLAPYRLIRNMVNKYNSIGKPILLYSHAWEFNRDQPKRKVGLLQKIAQSPMTYTTPDRIRRLLDEFAFTSIVDYLGIDVENSTGE